MADEFSILEYYGGDGGHRCGYCRSPSGFVAPGMWAHFLTVQDLQDLTDRGWRRSGKYCYKPANDEMCCPLYIIRCDAPEFVLSKSQKKVLRKMIAFLKTGKKEKDTPLEEERAVTAVTTTTGTGPSNEGTTPLSKPGVTSSAEGTTSSDISPSAEGATPSSKPAEGASPMTKSVQGPDPSKPPARKAKIIRRERKLLKHSPKEMATDHATPPVAEKATPTAEKQERKSLESYFEEMWSLENPAHKLTIRIVRSHPKSREFLETEEESHKVYRKYQAEIHKDPPTKCTMDQYRRFLVDSPLLQKPAPPEWECGYGSHHQQYFIDGKLVMVGVVDVLTNCVSSKYLYYDTNYGFLKLGVISALNEIALVRRLHRINSSLRYYCMGYYVHDCQKMRYKGEYKPSSLLCPVTNRYVPIELCKPKLDISKFARFSEEGECPPEDEGECPPEDEGVVSTLVLYRNEAMPFGMLRLLKGQGIARQFEEKVREYTSLVGSTVAQRSLLVLA